MGRVMVWSLCAAGALVVGACGGGGSDAASRDEYVDAIDAVSEDSTASVEDQRCVAEAFVDSVGVEQLDEHVTPDEIRESPDTPPAEFGIEPTDGQAVQFMEKLQGCGDIRGLVLDAIGQGVGPDIQACLDENLTDDLLQRYVVELLFYREITDDRGLQSDLTALASTCVPQPAA
jgi:hypothetical protein